MEIFCNISERVMNFVYQDWDLMKIQAKETDTSKCEKRSVQPATPVRTFQQLQEARIRKRLTVMDVAEAVDIPVDSIIMYENGSEAPNEEIRKKLLQFFEIE